MRWYSSLLAQVLVVIAMLLSLITIIVTIIYMFSKSIEKYCSEPSIVANLCRAYHTVAQGVYLMIVVISAYILILLLAYIIYHRSMQRWSSTDF